MHPDHAPIVFSGGKQEHGYKFTCNEIQSTSNITEKAEMTNYKCKTETYLFRKYVHIINHVGTNRCSTYFLRDTYIQ